MARKKNPCRLLKVPTKYTIIDDDNVVRGTADSYITAMDIINQLGFTETTEEGLDDWLMPSSE